MTFTLRETAQKTDHSLGPLHAPVVLVEYGDYECPYTAVAAPMLEQLANEYKSKLCIIFRHFPMKAIHTEAEYAAMAAEAAERQGKFWQMHKLLLQNYESLSMERIDQIAKELELNIPLFYKDMERPEIKDKIANDILTGVRSEVNSTPCIFINDLRYEGSSSYGPLRETIERNLTGENSAYL